MTVDIENIVGGACDTVAKVRWARLRLAQVMPLGARDQVVIGVDAGGLIWVGIEWCGPRRVVGRGANGADKALLGVLEEDVPHRFDEVVLASGDGIFTDVVVDLTSQGVGVTVVSHESLLSMRLRLAASRTVLLSRSTRSSRDVVPNPRSA